MYNKEYKFHWALLPLWFLIKFRERLKRNIQLLNATALAFRWKLLCLLLYVWERIFIISCSNGQQCVDSCLRIYGEYNGAIQCFQDVAVEAWLWQGFLTSVSKPGEEPSASLPLPGCLHFSAFSIRNASRMHSRFQAVPYALSSAVSHLERWTSLNFGQPPHVTSATPRAISGLFFHTSDALRRRSLHAANVCSGET